MLSVCALGAFAQPAVAAPNVVIIVTDDHRLAGTMDITDPASDPMRKTKGWFHTGSLPDGSTVAGGTWFPNGIATTPLCCPARASIFTGKYVHNHGVSTNESAENILNDKTLEEYLKTQLGYRTGIFGKFLNGWDTKSQFGGIAPYWDEFATFENQYFPLKVFEGSPAVPGAYRIVTEYSTDYLGTRATDFIQRATQDGQPFFLYVAPTAPHAPFVPEPAYATAPIPPFSTVTSSPKFLEEDRSDKPTRSNEKYVDYQDVEDTRAAQLRTLYSVDDMVDSIMAKLTQVGQQDNTIVFFIGDNGWQWGDHGEDSKGQPYEGSVKVPFYMRWPGVVPPNRTDPSVVANIDIAPTVMDAVNATADSGQPMDGQSLIDPAQQDLQGFASRRNRQFASSADGANPWKSLRTKTFVFIESDGADADSEPDFQEFYDLIRDPDEVRNLLKDSDPENDPPTAALKVQLDQDKTCPLTAPCPGAIGAPFPPDTAITAQPDKNTNKPNAGFVFTSTLPDSTFECKLDNAANWSDCGGTQAPSVPYRKYVKTLNGLSAGAHTMQVRAKAVDGTPDPTPSTYDWTVDSTPDTSIIGSLPAKITNQTSAQFSFSGTSGSTFECSLDGAAFVSCSSPQSYSTLGDGDHTFSVRVQGDPTPATYQWTVDATPPKLFFSLPSNQPKFGSGDLPMRARLDPDTDRVRGFLCSVDGSAFEPCGGGTVEKTSVRNLSSGQHTVAVQATDFAGNPSTDLNGTPGPITRTFEIERLPTFSSTPEAGWPEVSDDMPAGEVSEVKAVVSDANGGWYVGGNFTKLCYSTGTCHTRTDLAHIKADKTVDPNFAPSTNGSVRALSLSGGTLYAGGSFSQAGGGTTRRNVAAFSTANGSLTAWNPDADGAVNDITIAGSSAYLVGEFGTVGGTTRRQVAEVAGGGTGAVNLSWGGALNVGAGTKLYTAEAIGTSVYVGGSGTVTDGTTTRANLAAIDRGTGQISTVWNSEPKMCSPCTSPAEVRSLQRSPDGASIFVAGKFNTIVKTTSNPSTYSGHGAAVEIGLSGDGVPTGWRPVITQLQGNPATVYDIETADLTNGGAETRWSTLMAGDFLIVKALFERKGLVEAFRWGSPQGDGWPGDWNPQVDDFGAMYDTAVSGGVLAVGGSFTAFGFDVRRDLAFFRDLSPDTTLDTPSGGQGSQTFTYSSSELGSAFECALDTSVFTSCGNGSQTYDNLSPGTHTFKVRARDARANVDPTPASYTWTIQDGYARPKGATPVNIRLVPAYEECTEANDNASHGAPLVVPSCNPSVPASDYLTVGTPEANGQPAGFAGALTFKTVGESPIDPNNGDQADVVVTGSLTDVRKRSDLSEYTGELRAVIGLRITDRYNGAALDSPATATDSPLEFNLICSPTGGPEGGACNVATTADAVTSGFVREGKRAVWGLDQVQVFDGGADGDADTTGDNTLFAVQGFFAP